MRACSCGSWHVRERKHTSGQVETRTQRAHADQEGRQAETGSLVTIVDSKFHTEPRSLWSVAETRVMLVGSLAHSMGTMGAQAKAPSEEKGSAATCNLCRLLWDAALTTCLPVVLLESPYLALLGSGLWSCITSPTPISSSPPLLKPHSFLGDEGGVNHLCSAHYHLPCSSTSCYPKASASLTFKTRRRVERACVPGILWLRTCQGQRIKGPIYCILLE